jgi:signal transduction histidine kinase
MKAKRQPRIPGLFVSEALSDGAMNPVPQISNGCKESRLLAITERMAQSVPHDLRNRLSVIYSNVESMSEPGMTQLEREKLLQKIHAVCLPSFTSADK